jgi:hypothetical protein
MSLSPVSPSQEINPSCGSKDPLHHLYLVASLIHIVLVNTGRITPQNPFFRLISKMAKGGLEIDSDIMRLPI